MAVINGMYVQVVDESLDRDTQITQHPVEKGLSLSDTVRSAPLALTISGKIVDYKNKRATQVIAKLNAIRTAGSLVSYSGRNKIKNLQINSFSTTHSNENWGGADFEMTLSEVRIAKSAYVPKPVVTPKKKDEQKKQPVLKIGALVVFKGGGVYVSSDATRAAATVGRSTCKITYLNTASWSKHQYHLVSTDGKGVYGWVDKTNIEGVASNQANGKTNGGSQAVAKR